MDQLQLHDSNSALCPLWHCSLPGDCIASKTRSKNGYENPGEHPTPQENIDWESFGFSLNGIRTDKMWLDKIQVKAGKEEEGSSDYSGSSKDCLVPLQNLELSPTATVFNYGQALFEGLKACRCADGSIAVFRPEKNAERMARGATRFLMPPVPTDVFVQAVDAVVRGNARWVPPHGKGALYLRPLLMGTGEGLGVKPSTEVTFCIFASPVGNYFKGGLKAIRLQAVKGFCRAATGGAGAIKASGNYAPAFLVQRQVRERGFDEVLCLDAVSGEAAFLVQRQVRERGFDEVLCLDAVR